MRADSPAISAAIKAVADHAVAADALDRRPGEHFAKRGVVERQQVGERRRGKLGARQEGPIGRGRVGEAVPRADREAIVAAVDAIADRLAEFVRDRPVMLDRQIGNAAPGIEPMRRRESVGRAGGQAAGAGAAAMRRSRRVGPQLELVRIAPRNSQLPWSRLTRLVCLPCQPMPGRLRQRLFHDRRRVDEDLELGSRRLGDEPAGERLQRLLDRLRDNRRPARRRKCAQGPDASASANGSCAGA